MSFVGKILIVVQVVLTLCFMAFAGAVAVTHTNWKTKAEDAEKATASAKAERDALQGELTTARDDAAKTIGENAQEIIRLEGIANAAKADADDVRLRYNNTLAKVEQLEAQVAAHQTEAVNRKKESDILRAQNADLQVKLDAEQSKLAKTEDKLFNTETELGRLQKVHDNQLSTLVFLETVIKKNGWTLDRLELAKLQAIPPQIDGLVKEVEVDKATGRTKMIVISIGSDDQLVKGHKLHVFRINGGPNDPPYLGEVEIVSIAPDYAVCQVINHAKNGNIEVGDNVSTKL